MVDVMRGAIARSRTTRGCRSDPDQAALTGSPSRLIHLLAELIENAPAVAALYSCGCPGKRSPRFAIESRTRARMSPRGWPELNDRLANPPSSTLRPASSRLFVSASWPNGTGSGHAEGLAYGARPHRAIPGPGGDRGGVPDRAAGEPLVAQLTATATRGAPTPAGPAPAGQGSGSGFTDLAACPGSARRRGAHSGPLRRSRDVPERRSAAHERPTGPVRRTARPPAQTTAQAASRTSGKRRPVGPHPAHTGRRGARPRSHAAVLLQMFFRRGSQARVTPRAGDTGPALPPR